MPRGGRADSGPSMSGPHIGRIVGVHGLRGDVKVQPLSDFASRFTVGASLTINETLHTIERAFWHKGQVRVKIDGVSTREQAEALRGALLQATEPLPELDQDEYLVTDLIGMTVVEEGGAELGAVESVLPAPAGDLLQIGDVLIPVVRQFVLDVDASQRVITVRLIPGMKPGEDVEVVR